MTCVREAEGITCKHVLQEVRIRVSAPKQEGAAARHFAGKSESSQMSKIGPGPNGPQPLFLKFGDSIRQTLGIYSEGIRLASTKFNWLTLDFEVRKRITG